MPEEFISKKIIKNGDITFEVILLHNKDVKFRVIKDSQSIEAPLEVEATVELIKEIQWMMSQKKDELEEANEELVKNGKNFKIVKRKPGEVPDFDG